MKVPNTLAFLTIAAFATVADAQSLVDSAAFFDPEVRAQHGQTAGLTLEIDTGLTTQSGSVTGPPGVAWEHGAGGYVGISLLLASAHIRPFTETTGDSLVFGREVNAQVLFGGDLGDALSPVINANALTTWSSTSVLSGINVAANQLYQVSFRVTPGSGLPVGVLSTASFGVTSPGIEDEFGSAASLLDVLGLITVGSTLEEDVATFTFQSDTARTDLEFSFEATAAVGVGALGGTAGNRDVLVFSDFAVTPIPEPSVPVMSLVLGGALLFRRRR